MDFTSVPGTMVTSIIGFPGPVLQQMLDITGSKPRVILTNIDPAMISACQNIYKNTYHVHCI